MPPEGGQQPEAARRVSALLWGRSAQRPTPSCFLLASTRRRGAVPEEDVLRPLARQMAPSRTWSITSRLPSWIPVPQDRPVGVCCDACPGTLPRAVD